jgi:hypothetical protein
MGEPLKVDRDIAIGPGQTFVIDRFRPEDANGIAHLFFAEYGPSYPFDTYYYPERIIAENENGNILSVVARTPKGDIIGHGALYRSSPEFRYLYEIGQYIILPDYRTTFAAFKINRYIAEVLAKVSHPEGIFGEAVTHITATQKSSALIAMSDVAMEMDLMPSQAYEKSHSASGRVSCLMMFRSFRDRPHELFIPAMYREIVEYILHDMEIARTLTPAAGKPPGGSKSRYSGRFFTHAGVGRFNFMSAGADFGGVVDELEKKGRESETVVFQFFLNMGEPWVSEAVDILRADGYFFGGCAPRWFDSDGLLMQKIMVKPDFKAPQLHSKKAEKILRFVRSDWQRI